MGFLLTAFTLLGLLLTVLYLPSVPVPWRAHTHTLSLSFSLSLQGQSSLSYLYRPMTPSALPPTLQGYSTSSHLYRSRPPPGGHTHTLSQHRHSGRHHIPTFFFSLLHRGNVILITDQWLKAPCTQTLGVYLGTGCDWGIGRRKKGIISMVLVKWRKGIISTVLW